MAAYVLTRAAQADLAEIARYTLNQWGKAQSVRYAALLEKGLQEIATGVRPTRSVLPAYPALRVCRCEHHYVFHLADADRPPQIIAVLHERMDLLQRLKARLPEVD